MTTHTKDAVRVTRQEELLFGEYAPIVRLLGDFAVAGEKVRSELERYLGESRQADGFTNGEVDSQGRSPHTAWLDDLYERLWPIVGKAYDAHRDISAEMLRKWIEFRSSVDSQPAPETTDAIASGAGIDGYPCSNTLSEDVLRRVLQQGGYGRPPHQGTDGWKLFVGSTRLERIAKRLLHSSGRLREDPLDPPALPALPVIQSESLDAGEWLVERPDFG